MDYDTARPQSRKKTAQHTIKQEETEKRQKPPFWQAASNKQTVEQDN